jgi:hypothetical protein
MVRSFFSCFLVINHVRQAHFGLLCVGFFRIPLFLGWARHLFEFLVPHLDLEYSRQVLLGHVERYIDGHFGTGPGPSSTHFATSRTVRRSMGVTFPLDLDSWRAGWPGLFAHAYRHDVFTRIAGLYTTWTNAGSCRVFWTNNHGTRWRGCHGRSVASPKRWQSVLLYFIVRLVPYFDWRRGGGSCALLAAALGRRVRGGPSRHDALLSL